MTLLEAIATRHSVRQYLDKPIELGIALRLQAEVILVNQISGLNFQLILNDETAFNSKLAKYGRFENVKNYFALVGKKSATLDENCGYYGERLVLLAQQLGLNTCWVGLTYKKNYDVIKIGPDEKLVMVIAVGYGKNSGQPSKNKSLEAVSDLDEQSPAWYRNGVSAALLAPTAVNQQRFKFMRKDHQVMIKMGLGFYTKVDLGILKYHFELGGGIANFVWGDL